MSAIDKDFIRSTYQKLSDDELVTKLTQDAAGLTPEALELVQEEVNRRNLRPGIMDSVHVQQRETITEEELNAYCELLRNLPCPVTGSTNEPLNATLVSHVRSYVVITQHTKWIVIGSPDVLRKMNKNALVKSALLGWWGIPWGVIRTPLSLGINWQRSRNTYQDGPTEYLRTFVLNKVGEIEAYKNDREKLQQIIRTILSV